MTSAFGCHPLKTRATFLSAWVVPNIYAYLKILYEAEVLNVTHIDRKRALM
ncbi:hypothetical protein F441_07894 [Phytophthora nicotianae CJ01A1]|uniref:Uncharacterized protein n=6 Tax=Phytophthora nicotianae TaxID=4792 RepID=W2QCD5_PHYN3|nr:hypothetical protein PPTG_22801 [Phytophthora nicotianae INRA-310]ETI47940.1 hypothetical protein F443_07919 [Phytophthora nicotianae P1569]ETK87884.1 hypothetical protein L915_07751 [Phytophthora nicotianae]ETO76674.1 hypothetical protein F444_07967 [Phytophthora nicotianae P1976]ETP17755.1 hypothetical protein F441_07894 [Phytophthora nicotianae CJ01A1]ETP45785.1 hypothetical protein F442_07862 [Phytophthora nicotianae P10297]